MDANRQLLAEAQGNIENETDRRYFDSLDEVRLAQQGLYVGRIRTRGPLVGAPPRRTATRKVVRLSPAQRAEIEASCDDANLVAAKFAITASRVHKIRLRARRTRLATLHKEG